MFRISTVFFEEKALADQAVSIALGLSDYRLVGGVTLLSAGSASGKRGHRAYGAVLWALWGPGDFPDVESPDDYPNGARSCAVLVSGGLPPDSAIGILEIEFVARAQTMEAIRSGSRQLSRSWFSLESRETRDLIVLGIGDLAQAHRETAYSRGVNLSVRLPSARTGRKRLRDMELS